MIEFLDERHHEYSITDNVLELLIANNSVEITLWLLRNRPHDVKLTDNNIVAVAAALEKGSTIPVPAIDLLVEYGDKFKITKELLGTATKNCSDTTLKLLLNQLDDRKLITEDILKAGIEVGRRRAKTLDLLLDNLDHNMPITVDILRETIGHNGARIVRQLLYRRGK